MHFFVLSMPILGSSESAWWHTRRAIAAGAGVDTIMNECSMKGNWKEILH